VRLLFTGRYPIVETAGSYWLGFLVLFLINGLIIFIHEGAHAFAVKSYGREVTRGGFMIYFGMPAFFVDTTDIWLEDKRRRIAVSWAGPFAELILGSALAIFVTFSPYHSLNEMLFKASFVFLIGVFVNMNPLLELDGYYMLMDWLEMPLLRTRSLAFVKRELWKRIGSGTKLSKEEKIYAVFGALAGVYSILAVMAAIYFWKTRIYATLAELYRDRGLGGKIFVILVAIGFFGPLTYLAAHYLVVGVKKIICYLAKKRVIENDYFALFSSIVPAGVLCYLMNINRYVFFTLAFVIVPFFVIVLCCKGFAFFKGAQVRYASLFVIPLIASLVITNALIYFDVKVSAGSTRDIISAYLPVILSVFFWLYLIAGFYRNFLNTVIFLAGSLLCMLLVVTVVRSISRHEFTLFEIQIICFSAFIILYMYQNLKANILVFFSNAILAGSNLLAVCLSAGMFLNESHLPGGYVLILYLYGLGIFAVAVARERHIRPLETEGTAEGDRELLKMFSMKVMYALSEELRYVRGESFVRAVKKKVKERVGENIPALPEDAGATGFSEGISIVEEAGLIKESIRVFLKGVSLYIGQRLTKRTLEDALSGVSWREREVAEEYILRDLAIDVSSVSEVRSAYEDVCDVIRSNPIFSDASDEELKKIARKATVEERTDGEYIIKEGQIGDKFYIIKTGTVEVTAKEASGVQKHLALLTSGDYFGEIALLEKVPRTASCIARGEVEVISVSKEDFDAVVKSHFELAGKIDRAAAKCALVRKVPLFSDFTASQLRKIMLKFKTERYDAGARIVRQGDIGDKFYVIESGEVEVRVEDDTKDGRPVARLGRGEYFGEIALLAEVPRTAHVVAVSDCTVLTLSKEDFGELIKKELMAAASIEKVSSRRLLELGKRTAFAGD